MTPILDKTMLAIDTVSFSGLSGFQVDGAHDALRMVVTITFEGGKSTTHAVEVGSRMSTQRSRADVASLCRRRLLEWVEALPAHPEWLEEL